MAPYVAPPPRPRKPPPSWWWFLGPVVLTVAAVAVGIGALLSTLDEVDERYAEVRVDGEPHAVTVPTGDRAMLMNPTSVNPDDLDCGVTDERGAPLSSTAQQGQVSFGSEAASWESLLTFDPADAGEGGSVTVYVACRVADGSTGVDGDTVLVAKAPEVAAIVARVAAMVLGPLALGGAAFAWTVVLVVLQVVRRTGA